MCHHCNLRLATGVHPPVSPQVERRNKFPPTDVADKVIGVHFPVGRQVISPRKRLPASLASVGPLNAVSPLMNSQVAPLRVGLSADVALEGPHVEPHVGSQANL